MNTWRFKFPRSIPNEVFGCQATMRLHLYTHFKKEILSIVISRLFSFFRCPIYRLFNDTRWIRSQLNKMLNPVRSFMVETTVQLSFIFVSGLQGKQEILADINSLSEVKKLSWISTFVNEGAGGSKEGRKVAGSLNDNPFTRTTLDNTMDKFIYSN